MVRRTLTTAWLGLMLSAAPFSWLAAGAAQSAPPTQNPPVPRPFPGATPPTTPPSKPADPAPPPNPSGKTTTPPPAAAQVDPNVGSTPVYPGAEYLGSFDAGRGQRYHLFGTNSPFADIVTYYKTALKRSGSELSRTPAIHQFELGRFDDETMAFPPSVVVKDYTWNSSSGYLHVVGTTEKRYRTIIQIVPAK